MFYFVFKKKWLFNDEEFVQEKYEKHNILKQAVILTLEI